MIQRVTPNWLIDEMVEASGLTDNMTVLEPSCGEGNVLRRLRDNFSFNNLCIRAVELNKELAQKALDVRVDGVPFAGGVIHGDFLKHNFNGATFDRIIAAPPFKSNADIIHIQKMYELLNKKGKIVSLTSPLWMVNNEPHQVEFRKWLQGKIYSIKMLPDNTFMEKGKSVHTARIVISK